MYRIEHDSINPERKVDAIKLFIRKRKPQKLERSILESILEIDLMEVLTYLTGNGMYHNAVSYHYSVSVALRIPCFNSFFQRRQELQSNSFDHNSLAYPILALFPSVSVIV